MRVPFRTKAVLRQYYQFLRSKYIPAQTTFRQQKDNLKDIHIVCQGSSALAKYSVQSRHNTQAKIKMKKFASRALFSHS